MHTAHARSTYTGYGPAPALGVVGYHHGGHHHAHHHGHGHGHGFCSGCCHPRSACCCGCRECRKESRELLLEPAMTPDDVTKNPGLADAVARMSVLRAFSDTMEGRQGDEAERAAAFAAPQFLTAAALSAGRLGLGTAFIGGSCCVHLSIEYTPAGTADGIVGVIVQDSQDTQLAWVKKVAAGLGYQIKECIVTTKPGANLAGLAVGATARIRWCEVFSC